MKKLCGWLLACQWVGSLGAASLDPGPGLSRVEAGGVARIGDSGEDVELSHQVEGRTVVDRLPLHRSGNLRYFSAGVGIEERMAEYPPFALKLVFTAGGKPFLAGVSLTIQPAAGGPALAIPSEHVEGPWLFVDLPSGTYDITAAHGDRTQRVPGITVATGKQKTIHLRWAEEGGLPVKLTE